MRFAVIIGAGQMGRTVLELVNSSNYTVAAFGDNDPGKHSVSSVPPVLPVEKAAGLAPDIVLIAVMGEERSLSLEKQVRDTGYSGRIIKLRDLSGLLDVRGRTIRLAAGRIEEQDIPGCIAELGVYKGDTARLINMLMPDRTFYLFDTFEGFDERDSDHKEDGKYGFRKGMFSDTSAEAVAGRLPFPEKAVFRKGYFPGTAEGLEDLRFAFVSLDPDLYAPVLAGLEYFYPRLSPGGMMILHDYNNRQFPGAHAAVRDYEEKHGRLMLVPLADLHGSCVIIRPLY